MRIVAGLALAALVAGTVWIAPPASAELAARPPEGEPVGACANWASNTMSEIDICIYNDGQHGRYGTLKWTDYAGQSTWVDAVIGVERCQTNMNNCSTFGFTSGGGSVRPYGSFYLRSGTTDASYGWVFRACGDVNDHRASGGGQVCSPWMTGDPKSAAEIIIGLPTIIHG